MIFLAAAIMVLGVGVAGACDSVCYEGPYTARRCDTIAGCQVPRLEIKSLVNAKLCKDLYRGLGASSTSGYLWPYLNPNFGIGSIYGIDDVKEMQVFHGPTGGWKKYHMGLSCKEWHAEAGAYKKYCSYFDKHGDGLEVLCTNWTFSPINQFANRGMQVTVDRLRRTTVVAVNKPTGCLVQGISTAIVYEGPKYNIAFISQYVNCASDRFLINRQCGVDELTSSAITSQFGDFGTFETDVLIPTPYHVRLISSGLNLHLETFTTDSTGVGCLDETCFNHTSPYQFNNLQECKSWQSGGKAELLSKGKTLRSAAGGLSYWDYAFEPNFNPEPSNSKYLKHMSAFSE